MPRRQDLLGELNAAGGWPALLSANDGRRMQLLLDGLLQHRNVQIRWAAQSLVLLKSVVKNGSVSTAEAEPIARDLFDLENGHRKQGPDGSCTAVPRTRR